MSQRSPNSSEETRNVRLAKDITDQLILIAKRNKRTLRSQIEFLIEREVKEDVRSQHSSTTEPHLI